MVLMISIHHFWSSTPREAKIGVSVSNMYPIQVNLHFRVSELYSKQHNPFWRAFSEGKQHNPVWSHTMIQKFMTMKLNPLYDTLVMELDYKYALKEMNFVERYPNLVFPINFLSWILITKSSHFFIFFLFKWSVLILLVIVSITMRTWFDPWTSLSLSFLPHHIIFLYNNFKKL
jgi:hypothetical protein